MVGTVVHIAPPSTAQRTTEATRPRIRFDRQHVVRRFIMLSDLWPGLDLRHLAAFSAVAKTGSFARGAELLGYTQPAVSQQVAALEKIVGQRLFERQAQFVRHPDAAAGGRWSAFAGCRGPRAGRWGASVPS